MDLFDTLKESSKQVPLAEILRPKTLSDYLEQTDIVSRNSSLYNLLNTGRLFSLILWGPPGCGKTTLAKILVKETNANYIELSAVTSGVKDIKEAVQNAENALINGKKTVLFIDEIHRYSKSQQDALLPHVENGTVFLIGSTTENPSFSIIPPLLSRVRILRLSPLSNTALSVLINKGLAYLKEKYSDYTIDENTLNQIIKFSRGDARFCLNLVEDLFFASDFKDGIRILTQDKLHNLIQSSLIQYSTDEHYDLASAYQKSLRGSDRNAAIYYLAKMLTGGEDPRFIARRLIVCAAEDVGNADTNALTVALNAFRAAEILGMPEARIPLSQATEYVANAPKTNKSILSIDNAINDIKNGNNFMPPMHLRDSHYKDAKNYGFGEGYIYTHSNPEYKQQFLPDELINRNYFE